MDLFVLYPKEVFMSFGGFVMNIQPKPIMNSGIRRTRINIKNQVAITISG